MSNLISYSTILSDRRNYRTSGTNSGSEFNIVDFPGNKYFKVFFYFTNGDSENEGNVQSSGGLLDPTWTKNIPISKSGYPAYHNYNSAWSYLKLNDENERADLLQQFITLLSNISSESPWYFSEISGLDAALERKVTMERDFKFDEARQKISIKCLSDSFDDRIGTLLDLYRSIVWSWSMKREVVPSNLRKFDMGIFIFNDPVIPFSTSAGDKAIEKFDPIIQKESNQDQNKKDKFDSGIYIGDNTIYKSSYKYIELHNCEIDYNSSKSGVSTLNNKEGLMSEYTIDILFDDCYENRYNEFLLNELGDFIKNDFVFIEENIESNTIQNQKGLDERMNYYSTDVKIDDQIDNIFQSKSTNLQSILNKEKKKIYDSLSKAPANAIDEVTGTAKNILGGIVKRAVMGNLYTFSLTRLYDQAHGALQGHVWSTARGIAEYANDAQTRKNKVKYVNKIGNLFESQTIVNNL